MAENMIKFLRGNVASLPQTATEGALYFTKDEGVYLGLADGSYHRYGDFIIVDAVASLPAAGAHETCMYYCVAENILAKWSGTEWTQINKQKTLAELGGVAKSVYEAKIAALEQADTNNATAIEGVKTLVGSIPEGATATTVVGYIDEKTAGIASDATVSALADRVGTAETEIDTLQAAIGKDGSVTNAIAEAKKAGTDAQAAVDTLESGKVKDNADAIAAINNETTGILAQAKSYADGKDTAIAAAQTAAGNAQADVDALEAKVGTVANGKTVVGLIGTAQAAADAAQDGVNTLSGKIGTVAEGKTVVKMIEEAQAAATYNDTQIKADIKANADAITVLNGTGEGSVSKQVADAVAGIVAEAPEAYDTLKEISDWISSHASDASGMNSQINTNKDDIAGLKALVGTLPETATSATVIGYIDEVVAALNIGNYAKANDLAAAVARIGTAEGKITTLEGQVATINGDASTAGSIAKAAADTLSSAKTYADGLNTAMDIRVKVIENKNISNGANKVEASTTNGNIKIDGVETVVYTHPDAHTISEVTGLQGALDAKATVTALNAEVDRAKAAEGANDTAIKANATEIAKKANSADVYTKTETYTKDEVDALLTWGSF